MFTTFTMFTAFTMFTKISKNLKSASYRASYDHNVWLGREGICSLAFLHICVYCETPVVVPIALLCQWCPRQKAQKGLTAAEHSFAHTSYFSMNSMIEASHNHHHHSPPIRKILDTVTIKPR